MKSSDIPQKVMKRVVDLEARRVFLSRFLLTIICITFIVFIAVVATETYQEIVTRQIADFFAVFEEDQEIIAEFLGDTASTFWTELPRGFILLGAILLASFAIIVYSTKHARRILARKKQQLQLFGMRSSMNMWKIAALIVAVVVVVFGAGVVRTDQKEVAPAPTSVPIASESTPAPEAPIAEITLEVSQPTNQAVVSQSGVVVSGKTKPNAEVFVNELDTRANSGGNFSVRIQLEEGENYVIVVATDEEGNVAEQALTVTYEPQQ